MSTPSHTYEINTRRPPATLVGLVAWTVGIAGVVHLLAAVGLLPRPSPAWDMDQTILTHQAEAALTSPAADILLLGDSSCMMNVDAVSLGARSLATLSYLTFDGHAHLLRQYLDHHELPPHTVVLLMHPESLRRGRSEPYFMERLRAYSAEREPSLPATPYHQLCRALGLDSLRDRVLSRFVPRPLPPTFAAQYGFQSDLARALSAQNGTLSHPGYYLPGSHNGSAEYRMVERARPLAEELRSRVPAHSRLVIGVTPIPDSFASRSHGRRYQELLATLDDWLQPDLLLTYLPASLPDHLFADFTHLNAAGRTHYTTLLRDAMGMKESGNPNPDPDLNPNPNPNLNPNLNPTVGD